MSDIKSGVNLICKSCKKKYVLNKESTHEYCHVCNSIKNIVEENKVKKNAVEEEYDDGFTDEKLDAMIAEGLKNKPKWWKEEEEKMRKSGKALYD